MTRSEHLLLRVFAAWTVWVWGTRVWNVVGDDERSGAFKVVHAVLALVSIALAVAAWIVVTRIRRRDRAVTVSGPSAP